MALRHAAYCRRSSVVGATSKPRVAAKRASNRRLSASAPAPFARSAAAIASRAALSLADIAAARDGRGARRAGGAAPPSSKPAASSASRAAGVTFSPSTSRRPGSASRSRVTSDRGWSIERTDEERRIGVSGGKSSRRGVAASEPRSARRAIRRGKVTGLNRAPRRRTRTRRRGRGGGGVCGVCGFCEGSTLSAVCGFCEGSTLSARGGGTARSGIAAARGAGEDGALMLRRSDRTGVEATAGG